ncbi:MAG: TonB-dependent receptor [Candidatus Eremiobacteraeota bacterium]|nr:TonB-dependent receptor [Candidatus Eremiobacteraeota bacterium]
MKSAIIAVLLMVALLSQGTSVLAGTTGNLSGTLLDQKTHQPIEGATVTATSASQVASARTDATGRFTILSLNPDTYTVSAEKQGYNPASTPGVTISADQTARVNLTTENLRTIARVTTRARANLVQPGVTSDTYNINSAQAAAAAPLGSGGNLNNAYSAIAAAPGVNVPIGGTGWNNNAVYIHGNQSFFTSYEYDGVPVNRAFDNYNSSTESNLGLQQLEVYTGGGPSSSSSAGTSGFINQVIKTGTFPSFGSLDTGYGTGAFYHSLKLEYGGATQNRNFSYYIGASGYNQDLRYVDNNQAATLIPPGAEYDFIPQEYGSYNVGATGTNGRGVWPVCQPGSNVSPIAATAPVNGFGYGGQCFIGNSASNLAVFGNASSISDREDVLNLHFGIPHKDGSKDDIQLLGSVSALQTTYYSSPNDAGGYGPYTLDVTGQPYCPPSGTGAPGCAVTGGANYPFYLDASNVYNLPFGTVIQNANGFDLPTKTYLQPSSPGARPALAQVPADRKDTIWNDTGIVKLQYTKSLGSSAYARVFGYTFFSDWTQAGANSAFNCYTYGSFTDDCGVAANYDLITHTGGGEVQLADQIGQHLLNLTGNYTTANVSRFNNSGFVGNSLRGGSLVGYASQKNGAYTCYDPSTGDPVACGVPHSPSTDVAGNGPYPLAPAGSPAQTAGAQWITLQNGSTYGTFNTVKPFFLFTSLQDDWRPTQNLNINLGLRFDNYRYDLAPVTPGTAYYAAAISSYVCQNASGSVLTTPLKPGAPPPAPVVYEATCPSGYAHPAFSASSPGSYVLRHLSPRVSMTYTVDPLTVLRASAGEYTQPPISASLQYLNSSGNALTVWNATLPLGFNTPFHPIPLQNALQTDLSIEHQLKGTDVSIKLSPFFNYTNGYQQQAFIGPNFVTQVPVGAFRSSGIEAALSKGDFSRDGLSGSLAFTYTNAQVQYQKQYFGQNQIASANTAIAQFNTLTKAGGGAPCYNDTTGKPSACGAGTVLNSYYSLPTQSMLDPSGWYAPGLSGLSATNNPNTTYFDSPIISSLILNYKHGPFAITPSFQISEGGSYGGPYDVAGKDPRACTQNASEAGITAVSPSTNPLACNYFALTTGNASASPVAGQLFIPNPQTGSFAKPGQFRNPTLLTANVQMHYDVSKNVTALVTFANVFHTCFGGSSEPWTSGRYAPNANTCFYGPNAFYTSNFYNGTSPTDAAANGSAAQPWQRQSYLPSFYGGTIGSSTGLPFNAYLQLQIKL